jgi:hypothetical protein
MLVTCEALKLNAEHLIKVVNSLVHHSALTNLFLVATNVAHKRMMLGDRIINVLRIRKIFDRIRILTQENFRSSFFWKYFCRKYALKSLFMNQKVKKQRFLKY